MIRLAITGCISGLLLASNSFASAATVLSTQHRQELTPVPNGPFQVTGNRIVDARGRPFLIRGTQLAEFSLETAAYNARSAEDFGPYSGTALSAIRLRFNMNAVRVPLNVQDATGPGYWTELAKLVRRANEIDLLVILAAREPGAGMPSRKTAEFWTRCAAFFRDYPNVIFDAFEDPAPAAVPESAGDPQSPAGWNFWRRGGQAADGREAVGMEDLVHAIRAAGARQPILAMSWTDDRLFEGAGKLGDAPPIDDANIVYEASPRYTSTRTDAERDAHFGFLANHAPVVANDWDLHLNDLTECAALPSDPAAASELVQGNLNYFDAHGISWTVSAYEPGRLIQDFSLLDATTMENGWTCGHASVEAGLGRVVQAHMRSTVERGLFVTGTAGGQDVARGGYAIAYGPVMAERDAHSSGPHLPLTLGGVSVQVTDSLGATRRAGIGWAAAGWGQINFVIPVESAIGPARMTIVRADSSRASANFIITDAAPGSFTQVSCRGPAVGSATEVSVNGRRWQSAISSCKAGGSGSHASVYGDCRTVAIPVRNGAATTVRLKGSGFRYAGSAANIEVTIAGTRVPVVSFGPAGEQGVDQVTIEIPAELRGLGEADLLCHINGRVSNAVRIGIGGEKPAS
ncbi:MAG: cellulase family glycosylhydrolase [Bryobacteraceae bacterium]